MVTTLTLATDGPGSLYPTVGGGESATRPIAGVPTDSWLGREAEAVLHSGRSRRVHVSEGCASEVRA